MEFVSWVGLVLSSLDFTDAVLEALHAHAWPGNVRELRNVVERAVCRAGDCDEPIDAIVLDKTGTLTEGAMTVSAVEAPGLDDAARQRLLMLVASAERLSEHPIGDAIAELVDTALEATAFENRPGSGVLATVDGDLHLALTEEQRCWQRHGLVPSVDLKR